MENQAPAQNTQAPAPEAAPVAAPVAVPASTAAQVVPDGNAPAPTTGFDPRSYEGDRNLTPDEARLMLNYDPFEELAGAGVVPAPASQQPPAPPGGPPQAPAPAQAPSAAPAQVPQVAQQTPAPAPDPALAQLQVALQSLQAQNAALEARLGQIQLPGQNQQPQVPPQSQQVPAGNYDFNIPDDLIAGLRADDPTMVRASVARLVAGIGHHVHEQVLAAAKQHVTQSVPEIVRTQATQQEEGRQIFQDFYGSYPQFNTEGLRPVVRQAAEQVFQLYPGAQWGPQLKQLIGERVRMLLAPILNPQSPPQVQVLGFQPPAQVAAMPAGSSVPAQMPPQQVAPTARPGNVSPVNDTERMISEMLADTLGLR